MTLLYSGKTKDVYENPDGTYTLKLKDDATGKNGVFDPGENTVGLSILGLGRESLRLTRYFFDKLTAAGIPHHFIKADIDEVTMTVRPATVFGKGLEFICRPVADGSFVRRYGAYIQPGTDLDYLVEVTLKDDERGDPPITKDALLALGLLTAEEYETCYTLTRAITKLVADDLAAKGLRLHDIKFEFGKNRDGEIMLIDEISGGCMRAYQNGTSVAPLDLTKFIVG
ncbi:MAG: phosphoribosylaminoimidazolesuccinocarboxamide synthase [Oscillospiraceae bacterium]|nr:phosphoribosylaminoimidazolesuccinocarboxamide synthase [Oscillospiraceae bacterium]